MLKKTTAKCLVIQTFRSYNIPDWISRCIKSVRDWTHSNRYDYLLFGDEFYNFCSEEFLNRGNKNPQSITNLARLIVIRNYLNLGYERVIWMDADVFIFAPEKLNFNFSDANLSTGYAFGREVWMEQNGTCINHGTHNAVAIFTQHAVDLDMLIDLIKHIDAGREIASNFQIGVGLLRGLRYSLMFQTLSSVGLFSPTLLEAILKSNENLLVQYGAAYKYPAYAANLCMSLQSNEAHSEKSVLKTMDLLENTRGMVLNQFTTENERMLLPYYER